MSAVPCIYNRDLEIELRPSRITSSGYSGVTAIRYPFDALSNGFASFSHEQCIKSTFFTYVSSTIGSMVHGGINKVGHMKEDNLLHLRTFSDLPVDWDGYGALPIDEELIESVVMLVKKLDNYQPKIYPTGRGSIQLEYEKPNGEYLEFEIFQDGKVIHLYMDEEDNDHEQEYLLNSNVDRICGEVRSFHGS